jgi:pimeloyl-ACP methyl ester carboxylesterase
MEILSIDAVKACRDRLVSRGVDLGSYNLAETAADAEDIRKALGIEEWNLITLGTASAISFEIMRRFPEQIRAVVFDSPRPYQVDLFTEVVLGTERAFAEVVGACTKDRSCNRSFLNLGSMLAEALRRLHDDPSLITGQGENLRILVDDATAVRVLSASLALSPDFVAVFPLAVEKLRQHGWVDADPAGDWVT